MSLITPSEFDALTRREFRIFIERVFAELNPSTRYSDNFHIGVIAHKLDLVRKGEIKRLIINVPPRSMKSIAASVALPAWMLGHDPTRTIINVSYGQELADDLARGCRQVMQQRWYEAIFPKTRLAPTRRAVHSFRDHRQRQQDRDPGGWRPDRLRRLPTSSSSMIRSQTGRSPIGR